MFSPLSFSDVVPAGDVRRRAGLSFQRLHDAPFRFEAMVHASTAKEAPGDWLGRAMLGLAVLGQTLDCEPAYLEEIMARLPEALNANGYIGEVQAPGTADENQVGGHNGLLRGLCEVYLWKRDPRALAAIRTVVANLMVPTRPLYAVYPDRALETLKDGKPIGLTVKHEGAWAGLSTDIGIVFFTLDGLTQAYGVDPSPELRALIETMIARYAQIDVQRIGAQTHGTLSTLRGILRWWAEVDSRPELLALVRERFRLYREFAETENYANYNWFGKPDWTEACAVVDAFLLATELWRTTGEGDNLREAHNTYFNALNFAQRPNGGFGCDHCAGANGELFARPYAETFEAPWCCSMRGAEALARAAQYSAFLNAARDEVTWAFYHEGDATLRFADGEITLRIASEYPWTGRVSWTVLNVTTTASRPWRFFVPPGVEGAQMTLRCGAESVALGAESAEGAFRRAELALKAGDVVTLEFPLTLRVDQPMNPARMPGHRRLRHGPLVLGAVSTEEPVALAADEAWRPLGRARYECRRTGTVVEPTNELTYLGEAEARTHRAQILFPDRRTT